MQNTYKTNSERPGGNTRVFGPIARAGHRRGTAGKSDAVTEPTHDKILDRLLKRIAAGDPEEGAYRFQLAFETELSLDELLDCLKTLKRRNLITYDFTRIWLTPAGRDYVESLV